MEDLIETASVYWNTDKNHAKYLLDNANRDTLAALNRISMFIKNLKHHSKLEALQEALEVKCKMQASDPISYEVFDMGRQSKCDAIQSLIDTVKENN
jgi:hypothetical protein